MKTEVSLGGILSHDFLFFKEETVAVSALEMRWHRTHPGPLRGSVKMSAIPSPILVTV